MLLKTICCILVTFLEAASSSSCPAETWTIHQLRSDLEKRSARRSDKSIAEKLSTVQLSQQLTQRTLNSLSREFQFGSRTLAALDFLTLQSALLDPPREEFVKNDPPDNTACSTMFRAAAEFASAALSHMPDFIATRSTSSWDDAPPPPNSVTGFVPAFVQIHPSGSSEEDITYREGREVGLDGAAKLSMHTQAQGASGFTSRGEFGPLLRLILSDGFQSRLQWLRWENIADTTAAVFRYSVPESKSKFRLNFCCALIQRGRSGLDGSSGSGENVSFGGTPAFQGELYLDPVSGAVLRITVRTIVDKANPVRAAGLAIDYGPVEIGGKTYICPIHSVADATVRFYTGGRTIRYINRVDFVHYRRFGSESRILPAPSQ